MQHVTLIRSYIFRQLQQRQAFPLVVRQPADREHSRPVRRSQYFIA